MNKLLGCWTIIRASTQKSLVPGTIIRFEVNDYVIEDLNGIKLGCLECKYSNDRVTLIRHDGATWDVNYKMDGNALFMKSSDGTEWHLEKI
jgi:hypothetical protein